MKAEKELTDYKFALDRSSIVAITDQQGIIRHVNDDFCKISKYSSEELIGQDHRIINSGYHSKSFIKNLWATIAYGKVWRDEFCNKAKDGTVYWVDTTIVPFLNDEGKPYQYLSVQWNITERKMGYEEIAKFNKELVFEDEEKRKRAAELIIANKELVFQNEEKEKRAAELIIANKELTKSEKRYSDLFHLSPQPMWVYDQETLMFIQVNNAAIRNYGYTEEEFLRMTIKDIRPAEDISVLEKFIDFGKQNNQLFSQSVFRHKKKNGDIIQVEIQNNPVYFNKIKARLILANDITEKVQYIKAIEEQNKKLHDIAWTQSHMVRAPLARMMGIVNLVKEIKMTTSEREELLTHFIDSGNELDNIIRDITEKTEPVSFNKHEIL